MVDWYLSKHKHPHLMLSVTIIRLPNQPSEENKHTVGSVPVRKKHDGSIDKYKQTSLTVLITIIDCVWLESNFNQRV